MSKLHEVRAGEPITAAWANSVRSELHRIGRLTAAYPLQVTVGAFGINLSVAGGLGFDLVELNDTIQAGDQDKAAERFAFDSTHTPPWIDSGEALAHTADAMQSLYLAGERHLTFWHPAAGQRIPIPGVQFHFGKLAASLAAGGSAEVEVWQVSGGSAADSSFSLAAYDWLLPSGGSLASGTPVVLLQHLQSKRFYVVGTQQTPTTIIGKSDASTPSSNKGTYVLVHIYSGSPGLETDTGDSVEAWNLFGDIGASKWVACTMVNGAWYLIAAEC
jgi:hypothetical protein